MHHGTCVTHVPWCMSGSLTCGDGENVPGIPPRMRTCNFAYLARGPCHDVIKVIILTVSCDGISMHYSDVIMSAIASQTTSHTIVHSTVYSGADQRKRQSSASLAFVRGVHQWQVNSPHKGPVTRKMFSFMSSSCNDWPLHYVSWHVIVHFKQCHMVNILAAILQTTLTNAYFWTKIGVFSYGFHWLFSGRSN